MFKERIKTHHSAMSEGKKYMIGMEETNRALAEENLTEEYNGTIYIHVPFCNKICSFCNMRRSLQNPSADYADLIVREIENYAALPYIRTSVFDAVYFGGGTPTTLSAQELNKIITALKKHLNFTQNAEFTIETTVTELDEQKMDSIIHAGANRFSVGVQTFDEDGRMKMGRIGSGATAYERLRQLKSYAGVTVSMDLIYNYPQQTMKSLYTDLNKIIELNLDGFSMYSLINMKGSSIEQAQDEQNDETMFLAIVEKMQAEGYRFLELTKMVKTDNYRYIMNRHKGADTLPLGAGAGGTIHDLAMMNPINLKEYADSVNHFQERKGMLFVPQYKEIVKFKGDIQTTNLPVSETLYQDREAYYCFRGQLIENHMAILKNGKYVLTEKGIFWGNTISRALSNML